MRTFSACTRASAALTLVALATIWIVAAHQLRARVAGGRMALVRHDRQGGAGARRRGRRLSARAGRLGVISASPGSRGTCEGVAASARGGIAGFGAAMLGALWAYDGWNNVAPLAGEIRDPQRNLPRAFIGGTLLVAALYLFVNAAYYYALTPLQIASVPQISSVATEVLKRFLGPTGRLLHGRRHDDLLVRVAACERALQLPHSLRHGA